MSGGTSSSTRGHERRRSCRARRALSNRTRAATCTSRRSRCTPTRTKASSAKRRPPSKDAPTPKPPTTRRTSAVPSSRSRNVFGGDRCLFARPGLILGPRENIGRLPWWLRRVAKGGDVLAPGPRDLAVQYIDARDLAAFAIDTALHGPVNVLSRPGHTTMAEVLALCNEVTGSSRLIHVGRRRVPAGARGRAVDGAARSGFPRSATRRASTAAIPRSRFAPV